MDVHSAAVLAALTTRTELADKADHPYSLLLAGARYALGLQVPTPDPDLTMDLAQHLAPLIEAISITFVGEVLTMDVAEHQPPPGVLETLYELGNPDVATAVLVATVYRGGTARTTTLPYHLHDGDVHWHDSITGGIAPDGQIGQALRLALLEPADPLPQGAELLALHALARALRAIGCDAMVEQITP